MEWISVHDRLPEYGDESTGVVIVSGIDDTIGEGKRYVYYAETHAYGEREKAEDIFSVPGWSKMNVTHWMPLPEPPQ